MSLNEICCLQPPVSQAALIIIPPVYQMVNCIFVVNVGVLILCHVTFYSLLNPLYVNVNKNYNILKQLYFSNVW